MSVEQQTFSRRELIIGSAKMVGALAVVPATASLLAACENKPTPTPEIYNGPLIDLSGRPLITNERFRELTNQLIESGDILLEKIGKESRRLHNGHNNPEEFGSIIDEASTPLAITRDHSDFSFVTTQTGNEDGPGFLVVNGISQLVYVFGTPSILGINIATTDTLEKNPLQESLFLAKEHLSLTLDLRMFSEYGNNFLAARGNFLELDGTPMKDKDHLLRAGHAAGTVDLQDETSDFWKLGDIAPLLMLTPSIIRLVEAGRIPKDAKNMSAFYIAANVVNRNPRLLEIVVNLHDDWANSPNMNGPAGFTDDLFDAVVLEAINKIYGFLYPDRI